MRFLVRHLWLRRKTLIGRHVETESPSGQGSATSAASLRQVAGGVWQKEPGQFAQRFEVGDGNKWTPNITVKGGSSGFYTIKVNKTR